MTAWTEKSQQISWDRTAGTGQPGQDSQNRTDRKYSLKRIARTGLPGYDCQAALGSGTGIPVL
jgi:hypothetical protein